MGGMSETRASGGMQWVSTLSEEPVTRHAAQDAAAQAAEALGGRAPDGAFVFFSTHHRGNVNDVAEAIAETLVPAHVLGCSAGGIIGAGREIEERAALSITAARLPGVRLHSFAFDDADLPDEDAPPRAWESLIGVAPADQ